MMEGDALLPEPREEDEEDGEVRGLRSILRAKEQETRETSAALRASCERTMMTPL